MGPSLKGQRHANFKAAGLKIPKLEKEKRRAKEVAFSRQSAHQTSSSSYHSAPTSPSGSERLGASASEPLGASGSYASESEADVSEESNRVALRRELALLEEQQRREQAKARVIEASLADTHRKERKAHDQAEQQRSVLQHHCHRHDAVTGELSTLKGQLREQTQSAQRLCEAQASLGGGSSGSRSCPQLPAVRELPGLTALRQPPARTRQPQARDEPAAKLRSSSSPDLHGSGEEGSLEDPSWSDSAGSGTLQDFFKLRDAEHKKKAIRFISPADTFSGLKLRNGAVQKKPESPERRGSVLGDHMRATWNTGALDILDEEPEDDMRRAAMRELMARHAGGRKPAFYRLDINRNGVVSYSEFENNFPVLLGISMPNERWASDRLKAKIKDVFRLFDHNGKGQLDLDKIFPGASKEDDVEVERMSTPEFWTHWAKGTRGVKSDQGDRLSSWKPKDAYEELDLIMGARELQDDSNIRGKKMRQQWKRLKSNGKSDGRVREIVALHLPRGSGPEDRDGVPMFDAPDVQRVRRLYYEQINDRTRSIQKGLFDLREQRKTLMNSRHQFQATLQPMMRKQAAAAASKADAMKQFNAKMAAAEAIKGGFAGALGAVRDKMKVESVDVPEDVGPSFSELRKKFGVDEDALEDLYKVWMKFSDSNDALNRRQFMKFLATLCPDRHLVNCDLEAWWEQIVTIIVKGRPGFETPPEIVSRLSSRPQSPEELSDLDDGEETETPEDTPRTTRIKAQEERDRFKREETLARQEKERKQVKCTFAHFVSWYHSCELRVKTKMELNMAL